MSLHYELVVAVYLRDDLDETGLAEVRWHLELGPRPKSPLASDGPLFGPEGRSYLPGGDITRLIEEPGSRPIGPAVLHGFFVRRYFLDDTLYEVLAPLCEWLAAVAVDGYAGFWREEDALVPHILIVRDGHTYLTTAGGEIGAATQGAPPWPGPGARR
jgi:hypothetical protein